MGKTGRPRKPLALHKFEGTYREDRHGERAEAPLGGKPERPHGLSAEARKLWDRVVPQLVEIGVAKSADQEELEAMCRLWSMFKKVARAAEKDPLDPELKNAVLGYHKEFSRIAVAYGLNPQGREKLVVAKAADKPQGKLAKYAS